MHHLTTMSFRRPYLFTVGFAVMMILATMYYIKQRYGTYTAIFNYSQANVYREEILWDMKQELDSQTFNNCVRATVENLQFPMCIHDPKKDTSISQSLSKQKYFEEALVSKVLGWMRQDRDLGLVDIGANIGIYTLPVAHIEHQVVAVEPVRQNYLRLMSSLTLGGVSQQVVLVKHPLSSTRQMVTFKEHATNQGMHIVVNASRCVGRRATKCFQVESITMDDLLEVVTFKRAVLKMDIQGHEWPALSHSQHFFSHLDVRHILMEWCFFTRFGAQRFGQQTVDYLVSLHYTPYDQDKMLNVEEWMSWPLNVYWKKDV